MRPAVAEGTHLGPYEVVDLIGRGGMGEVYRARDPRLAREVAVKVLPAEVAHDERRLARFEREARAVAALNHPNILTVYDVGNIDGIAYLVTELLEGQTLREWLLTGSLPAHQALGWAVEIARGLEAAHARGIVHRDLKPSNVFVTADGRLKVLDFGLARATLPAGAEAPSTGSISDGTPPASVAGTLAYMSPEQLRGAPLDGRSDLFSFGVVLYEMLAAVSPFQRESGADVISAILNEPAPPLSKRAPASDGPLARIVERCLEKRAADRFASAHDLVVALEALQERPGRGTSSAIASEPSPYPGLASFTERDAADFFGREREVAALWEKLHGRHLLAVIGPSGVGKTSFVRAGVVASRPPGWAAVVATPGRAPVRALIQALAPELAEDRERLRRLVAVEEAADLIDLAAYWRRRHDEALLVVDQLEELFTLSPPEVQADFAAILGRLATEAGVHVLLVLRDDFLIRTLEQPALRPVLGELTALLPVSGEDLHRAVVEPARKHGCRFEDDALVDALVGAVEGERGALPLLAFAVARLWEERDRNRKLLTRESYQAIGGVEGALARHAEATLDRIGPERQGLVREIFRNLVTAQGTRAVADRDELLTAFPDREAAEAVLGQLVDARLLTSYEPEGGEGPPAHHRVEIVHESLLRSWPRLVRWQTQDADGAVLRDQLRQAARLWEEKGRTRDLLWTGTAYRDFAVWHERYPGTLTELEQDYAGAMVEREHRRKRLRRGLTATAFVVLAAIAVVIGLARQEAAQSATRAEASRLVALAQLRLEDDPTEALAMTTASLELADTEAARVFVVRALSEAPPARELAGLGQSARAPSFSPDGRWLAAAGHEEKATVWASSGEQVATLSGHALSPRGPNRPNWGPGGVLVTGLNGFAERLHLWSLPQGRKLRTIELGGETWWQIAGEDLLTQTIEQGDAGETWRLRSWPLPEGAPRDLGRLDPAPLAASDSRFTPNGRGWLYASGDTVRLRGLPLHAPSRGRVVTRHASPVVGMGPPLGHNAPMYSRDRDGELRILRFPGSGSPGVETVRKPDDAPSEIYPEPSERWLVNNTASERRTRLWSRNGWPEARPLGLQRSGSWYGALTALDARGNWVVTSTGNFSRLTFWPVQRAFPSVVESFSSLTRPLAFSPDGRWLASGADSHISLWPLGDRAAEGHRTLELPEPQLWTELAFDPNARFLLAVGSRGGVYVVPLGGGPPRRLSGFSSGTMLNSAAISPTGRRVAAAYHYGERDRSIRVWDLEQGTARRYEVPSSWTAASDPGAGRPVYDGDVASLVFLDESTLLSAGDGGIWRWNLADGSKERLFTTDTGQAVRIRLAADGRHALARRFSLGGGTNCDPVEWIDLGRGVSGPLPAYGDCGGIEAIDLHPDGQIAAAGSQDGLIRVGRVGAGPPHILAGHDGPVVFVAISPDLRWIASTGEDNTLRLWPMPDLDAPPLHTLPHEELVAKLKSLTNLRAVRDPEAPDGWRIDLAPFPGWKEVPTW